MSVARNPWGATVTTCAAPVKLHDVMDEELAAKLQREEEEEWEREIEAQFGDRNGVGWCFVEVPSTDSSEFGVMSVVQQEVPMEEQTSDPNDPDYAFALELQAQEAEEYDRLRRQEASSMERIQVMQQDPPKSSRTQRDFRAYGPTRSRRSVLQYQSSVSSADFAVHIEEGYEYDADKNGSHGGDEYHHASDYASHHDDVDEEDMFLEDDLPIKNFHTLEITRRSGERERKHYNRAVSSSSSSSTASQHHHPSRA